MKTVRLAAALAASSLLTSVPLAAQEFPNRPVTIVSPFSPGGGTDIVARAVAEELRGLWGHNAIVENVPGASGAIGGQQVAVSEPDGYTLVLAPNSYTIIGNVQDLPFDVEESFTPIGLIATSPLVLAVNRSVDVDSVEELIAYDRANPGTLLQGSAGIATAPHLAGELFNHMAGTEIAHIPYQGSGQVVPALLGNEVQLSFGPLNSIESLVQNGDMKVLAVLSDTRYEGLPDVPTVAEGGLEGYSVDLWYAFLGPSRIEESVVEKLNADLNTVLASDTIAERFAQIGFIPAPASPEELRELIHSDVERWRAFLEEVPIRIDQ